MIRSTPAIVSGIRTAARELETQTCDLLQDLVRIPSITGNEIAAQQRVAGQLTDLGLSVDVWAPTYSELALHSAFSDDGLPLGERPVVVGKWSGTNPTAPSLILNGHIDVVPVGDERAWHDGPWSGAIHDGRLWGRGSCDMKGGLAAGIMAIAILQRMGLRPRGDILIESVIGEETGGAGTLATLLRGYRADAAIILEPTSMALCPIGAGALSFRLHVFGKAAHGALRQEGVSAIAKFDPLLKAIESLENSRNAGFHHPLFDPRQLAAPISIGRVQAGDWPSTVPEKLTAEGRFGILPGENAETARHQFEAAIAQGAATDSWLQEHPPEVEWFEGQFESGETPSHAPILATLSEIHQNLSGRSIRTHGVPYGSDLRLFTNNANMHAALYGPGDVRVAHSLNEYVPLDEVALTAQVIALTIVSWCGVD